MIIQKLKTNQPRQEVRYHILPVSRINKTLQYSAITRNREPTRFTYSSTQLKLEVTVEFIGLNTQPVPTLTQFKHRTFPRPFFVTFLKFTSTDEPTFDYQWLNINFYNPISGTIYKNNFLEPTIIFAVILYFSLLQSAITINSEFLIQPDDRRITQLLATYYDCSNQYEMQQLILIRVQKCP